MQIKLKKLNQNAVIPRYAKPGDACLDLTAVSAEKALFYVEYGTGLAIEVPENHVALLFARSSITNTGLLLANGVGVIDSQYRGEIKFRFYPKSGLYRDYQLGDRIGQIMIVPYPQIEFVEVDELSETNRGTGGYGSTGS